MASVMLKLCLYICDKLSKDRDWMENGYFIGKTILNAMCNVHILEQ